MHTPKSVQLNDESQIHIYLKSRLTPQSKQAYLVFLGNLKKKKAFQFVGVILPVDYSITMGKPVNK